MLRTGTVTGSLSKKAKDTSQTIQQNNTIAASLS